MVLPMWSSAGARTACVVGAEKSGRSQPWTADLLGVRQTLSEPIADGKSSWVAARRRAARLGGSRRVAGSEARLAGLEPTASASAGLRSIH